MGLWVCIVEEVCGLLVDERCGILVKISHGNYLMGDVIEFILDDLKR